MPDADPLIFDLPFFGMAYTSHEGWIAPGERQVHEAPQDSAEELVSECQT